MVRIGTLVMHVTEARRAAEFWRAALGYAYRDGDYAEDSSPVLVSPDGTGTAIALDESDRTHLDLHVDSAEEQRAEVERLLSLGASRVEWPHPENARFTVLADTEGNLFCVVNKGALTPVKMYGNRGVLRRPCLSRPAALAYGSYLVGPVV